VQAPLSQLPKIDIEESRDREKCLGGERRRQTDVGRTEIEMVNKNNGLRLDNPMRRSQ